MAIKEVNTDHEIAEASTKGKENNRFMREAVKFHQEHSEADAAGTHAAYTALPSGVGIDWNDRRVHTNKTRTLED
jgi:hypothetical protein